MIDIHCHMLPGLDDGPDTLDDAVRMAEAAAADGIRRVVCTPHSNDMYKFDPEVNVRRRDELQARIGPRLELLTGCDFHMNFENLQDAEKNPSKYTIAGKNYLLVEFADFSIPPSMDDALHKLMIDGLRPIITHPERNPVLCRHPERIDQWITMGCAVQVTAGSLTGRFGNRAQQMAERWLDSGRVHFIATDAHDTKSRPPRMREVFELIAARRGADVASALCVENPRAATEGAELPYVPDISAASVEKPRKGWKFW